MEDNFFMFNLSSQNLIWYCVKLIRNVVTFESRTSFPLSLKSWAKYIKTNVTVPLWIGQSRNWRELYKGIDGYGDFYFHFWTVITVPKVYLRADWLPFI